MKILPAFMLLSSFFLIVSCKKKDCSDDSSEIIQLTANTPVYEGWPLYLTTESNESCTYEWTGPNGWHKNYDYYSNMNGSEIIESMTQDKAGKYAVYLRSEGCVVKRAMVDVVISPVPAPPCNTANNTSTTNLGGVGGVTYTYVSSSSSGSTYNIQASNASQAITFNFNGDHVPLPGVYKTESGYYPSSDAMNKVGVYIGTGFYDFVIKPDFDVYVNKVNGKTVISFCSAGFNNPVGSTNVVISAKVTLP